MNEKASMRGGFEEEKEEAIEYSTTFSEPLRRDEKSSCRDSNYLQRNDFEEEKEEAVESAVSLPKLKVKESVKAKLFELKDL